MKATLAPRQQVSKTFSVPSPVGGLNVVSALADMPPTDAILLNNFWPESYGCSVRPGYREHATGLNGDVCSLLGYNATNGTLKVFAVDQSQVFDVSAGGAVGVPLALSTNPYWQWINFSNASGTHLIAFNGADNGIWYSGAGFQRLTLGNGTTNGTWSNVDPKNLIHVTSHQKRIWAVEKGSTKGWYLPPEQIYGVATAFDFGPVFIRGGYLQQLITWTMDSGDGLDDKLLAISSSGDIAVYTGTDPSSASTWKLDGVFYAGSTFMRRCATRLGGDVAILTQSGITTMNLLVSQPAEIKTTPDFVTKVQPLLSSLANSGYSRPGWQLTTHLPVNMLLVNVPGMVTSENVQYAWNSTTKAWTQFSGYAANCWLGGNASLFFGSTGRVLRAWEGVYDDVKYDGTGGKPVSAEAQQAFSYFGLHGQTKHYKMVRPTFLTEGGSTFKIGINTDFRFETVPSPTPIVKTANGLWDLSFWDNALWSGGVLTSQPWVSVTGVGFAASVRVKVDASSPTVWASTDWILEPGGPI